ncbi:c2H2-type domain-containing protein [Trichonephila clavipes]|nr:c2H2-type domain-containing protein [Trichonephila clavipes]
MVFDGLEQVGLWTEHMALGVIVHCWDSGLRRQWVCSLNGLDETPLCERKLEKEAGKRKRVDLSVSSRKKKTQLFTSAENSTADPENIFLPPKENERAFQKAYKTFNLPNNDSSLGIKEFLLLRKEETIFIFRNELETYKALKVSKWVHCIYSKATDAGKMIKNVEFKTPNNEVLQETNLARLYDDMSEKIVKESEDFEGRDSGWTLDEILRLEVRTNRYSPFRGSSSFIEVPKQIAETKAIINVINKKDSQCFMWSILAALYPNTSNPNKTSSYVPHLNKLNFDGISFPTPLNELSRGHYKDPVVYRGIDAPKIFIEKLEKDAIEIENIYKKSKPLLPLTESEKQLYDNANNCYVCGQTFHENNIKFGKFDKNTKKDEFKYMKHYFDSEKIDLLLRKGVFPYDYFDSFEKCKDSCLPPISKFYNKLNEEAISVEDYNHACKVFNEFHLNNLGEYCDLYVKTDVLLLTDLFENFRKICMQTYKLDPCWYFTTPALSWDAMLLHTKVAIELFTDYDMLLFIEKGVRGGISQCCNRYAIANNRYMSNFNPDDEIKYLMYLDANNLYGYAMSKYLPLKDFVWSDNDLTEQDILNLSDESDVGYILEVDLEYPSDLHDKHSDFPLAPENKPPPNCKEPRLLTTLEPKTKYVLHYSNLKLYLKLGRKTTQLVSRNETTQLGNRNETTQLASRNETTQLCTAVDRLQLPTMPTTAYNRLQPPTTPATACTACNRLQPPAPPAPPLQQNRLFLPTSEVLRLHECPIRVWGLSLNEREVGQLH